MVVVTIIRTLIFIRVSKTNTSNDMIMKKNNNIATDNNDDSRNASSNDDSNDRSSRHSNDRNKGNSNDHSTAHRNGILLGNVVVWNEIKHRNAHRNGKRHRTQSERHTTYVYCNQKNQK